MESIYTAGFTLRQLAHFVAAAERGTVSGAAEELHMSQSAVSASITELERTLGAELCVRRKAQGVALTPTGKVVLQRARQLLGDARELGYLVKGGEELVGPLAVGCYSTLAPTVLPPLLEGFSRVHPLVTLDFIDGHQDDLQVALRSGELDLAVMYAMDLVGQWNSLVLFDVRPHILLAAQHPLAQGSRVRLSDLAEEPMILYDAPPSRHNTLAILERAGLAPEVRYRTRSYELTRGLVARGMGWAFLLQRPKNNFSYEGLEVRIMEIEDDVPSTPVILVWPRQGTLTPRATALAAYARSFVAPPVIVR